MTAARCYLDELDDLLATGAEGISPPLTEATVRSVASRQETDGGFRGRQGGSDPYYTDFALRTLWLLDPGHAAIHRVPAYLESLPSRNTDVISGFNRLNADRLLRRCGRPASIDRAAIAAEMLARVAGGLADGRLGAYQLFLASLSLESAALTLPEELATGMLALLRSLRRSDGGFAESPAGPCGQTSATAAAVAVLQLHEAMPPEWNSATGDFLQRMQGPDGGLRAHAGALGGDLLSTFVGLLTLWALDAIDRLDVAGAARFLRCVAGDDGGFRASLDDPEADVEYTWYGVGTLSLLRLWGSISGLAHPRS